MPVSVLLLIAIGMGVPVLCFSSTGHSAMESPYAPCCGMARPAGAPVQHGPLLLSASACGSCTDIPLLWDNRTERAPKAVDLETLPGLALSQLDCIPGTSSPLTVDPEHCGFSNALESCSVPLRC
jgi:hypothetical protein